jgi:hypothetical protein
MQSKKRDPIVNPARVTRRLTLVVSDGLPVNDLGEDYCGMSDYDAATELIEHLRLLRDRLEPTSELRVDLVTLLGRLENYRLLV